MTLPRKQAGIALVAVLWVVSGLAVIVAAVLAQTRTDLQLTRTHVDLAKARAVAEAGIYQGVYELLRSHDTVRLGIPEDVPPLEWEESAVNIRIQNETGKIDVNTAHQDLIRNLFQRAGASQAQAHLMAGRYDRFHRFDDDEPEDFASIEAFAAALELPRRVWRTISPWITVYNGQAGINPYIADEEVLALVPGFDASFLKNPLRKGSPDRLQSRFTGLDRRYFTDRLSPVYTITARATVGVVSATVEATIEMSAHRSHPYTILNWSETPRFRGG